MKNYFSTSKRPSGLIRNSYLLNKQIIRDNSWLGLANTQDERFTPFLVIKFKGNDCWLVVSAGSSSSVIRGHIYKTLATLRPRKSIVRLRTPVAACTKDLRGKGFVNMAQDTSQLRTASVIPKGVLNREEILLYHDCFNDSGRFLCFGLVILNHSTTFSSPLCYFSEQWYFWLLSIERQYPCSSHKLLQ
jgi:hypothetical protein